MSRGIGTANEAQVDATHLQEVVLVKLEFDTPMYVHSGIGSIVYDSNTYLGVGILGGISAPRESEALGPSSVTLSLSGVGLVGESGAWVTGAWVSGAWVSGAWIGYGGDALTEALDSGNLYDKVTIYKGYRQDDGTLVDTPWVLWKGWFEYATIEFGDEASVGITCQHDLSQLSEKDGRRYSQEDQASRYASDVAFEFTARMNSIKLLWGGGPVGGGSGRGGDPGPRIPRYRY